MNRSFETAIDLFRLLAHEELLEADDVDEMDWHGIATRFLERVHPDGKIAVEAADLDRLTAMLLGIIGELREVASQSSAAMH